MNIAQFAAARPGRLIVALLSSGTLVLSACSSGAGTSRSTGADAAPTSAPVFTGSYKIMQIANITQGAGVVAPAFPEAGVGAKAAAKVINDSGGVNGKSIDLVVCDTKGQPNGAVNCANQGVADGVIAFVGDVDPTNSSYLSVAQGANVPAIGAYALGPAISNPISYPISGGALAGDVGNLASQGAKSISLAFFNSAPAAGVTVLLKPVTQLYPGLTVSLDAVPPTAVDMAPYVQAAEHTGGIVLGLPGNSLLAFVNAYSQLGAKTPLVDSGNSITPTVVNKLGSKAEGMYFTGEALPANAISNPAVAEFDKAMDAIDPSADKNEWAENAYASVKLFAAVTRGLTQATGQAVIQALNHVDHLDLGIVAPLSFLRPASPPAPLEPRIFNPAVVYGKVHNGQIVPVSGQSFQWINPYTGNPVT